jgi:hypothetical protein
MVGKLQIDEGFPSRHVVLLLVVGNRPAGRTIEANLASSLLSDDPLNHLAVIIEHLCLGNVLVAMIAAKDGEGPCGVAS